MERDEIEELIYRILTTEDEEIDCGQLSELIARYVDLEVDGANAPQLLPLVHQHLEQCNACSELHAALHELAVLEEHDALPAIDTLLDEIVAGDPAAPSPGGQRFDAPGPSPSPPQSYDAGTDLPEATSFFRVQEDGRTEPAMMDAASWFRWGWFAAAAALVIVVLFGVWGWRQSSVIADLEATQAFIAQADRTVLMQGTQDDPDARGYLFISEGEKRGLLVVGGLNQLPSDKVYQMWLRYDDRDAISAGTFVVGAEELGRAWVEFDGAPSRFTSLAITLEPDGGSERPTSSPVCVWGEQL